MAQDPQPQDPTKTSAAAPKPGGIDIEKVLLPQKEVRKVESTQRVSAGVLLDQEIKAGSEGLQPPTPKQAPIASAPTDHPAPNKEESIVQPLETYQGAIEHMMQGSDISMVSIAAAEAQRRAQKGRVDQPLEPSVPFKDRAIAFAKKFAMIAGGVLFLAVAAGILAYLYVRPTTVPVQVAPNAPFIAVDETQTISITADEPAANLMTKLTAAKDKVSLSLGLIERLVPVVTAKNDQGVQTDTFMDVQTFLSKITPHMPSELQRAIEPTYILGIHVYDSNQPFLIFHVDSYQEAFSGMLEWEYYMKGDLSPLFTYIPRPRISAVSTTASTTATSTALKPTTQPTFIDKIVENHDARVLQNDAGDSYLLWTFVDRNTLVITTNGATLREIISRLQNAPVTAIPTE